MRDHVNSICPSPWKSQTHTHTHILWYIQTTTNTLKGVILCNHACSSTHKHVTEVSVAWIRAYQRQNCEEHQAPWLCDLGDVQQRAPALGCGRLCKFDWLGGLRQNHWRERESEWAWYPYEPICLKIKGLKSLDGISTIHTTDLVFIWIPPKICPPYLVMNPTEVWIPPMLRNTQLGW